MRQSMKATMGSDEGMRISTHENTYEPTALYVHDRHRLTLRVLVAGVGLLGSVCAGAAGQCYKANPVNDVNGKPQPIAEVCKALVKNLNEFCDEPPMVCGIKIHPKYAKQFTFPDWQPVELNGSISLVESAYRTPWESVRDKSAASKLWEEDRPAVEAALSEGRLTVKRAMLDLFQLGEKVETYRIDYGDCEKENADRLLQHAPEQWNLPLKTSSTRTALSPNSYRFLEKSYNFSSHAPITDVFLHRDQVYWYFMHGYYPREDDLPAINKIHIRRAAINASADIKPTLFEKEICDINYRVKETVK